jgi:hypothetical protein
MSAFHHLGYFPFCIERTLTPLSHSVEMPLADAMKLFWSVKQARFRLGFSYNAHLFLGGGGTLPQLFVRAEADIDQTQPVFGAGDFVDRVCRNESITVSGSVSDVNGQGSTQYILRLFANSFFFGTQTFPRVAANLEGAILPDATVRVGAIFRVTNASYYSTVFWNQGLNPPPGPPLGFQAPSTLPCVITIDGATYALSTSVGYQGYPHINVGGPVPSPAYSILRADFTTS